MKTCHYRNLFRMQLTEIPKKELDKQIHSYDQEHGWVFFSNDCREFKAVRTYKTLYTICNNYTYFTPNTFYRNDKWNEATLRWLNVIVIDIDTKGKYNKNKGITVPNILERIHSAGIPMPSMIVQTLPKLIQLRRWLAFC